MNRRDLLKSVAAIGLIQLPPIHSQYAGGEVMGVMGGHDGAPDYLLIDLGEAPKLLDWEAAMKWAESLLIDLGEAPESLDWEAARKWAESRGGSLPTRREQSVMFGNRGEWQYEPAWYWSCEQSAGYEAYAWFQDFYNGYQYDGHKDTVFRARAVRRVPFTTEG